ncbi:3-hydroxy-3-methylglutaryl-coenzyme (HMG-CoA) reductase isozyme [Salix suchowensis]|nr:3-hydroxy-3-methylglutaryl-coenzyme (HMG-CoA) reductase isozyme [Salix suchowensis]
MFRTLLRPFAIYAAYSPIETIVFFFVVGTLAYFNILSAIKNSAFLATPYPSGNPYASTDVLQTPITDSFAPVADALPTDSALSGGVRPAYAVFRNEKWVQARESDWIYREEENVEGSVELQPLVFALEKSSYRKLTLLTSPLASSLKNITAHLTHELVSANGNTYSALCYSSASKDSTEVECFSTRAQLSRSERALTHTLTFVPGGRDEFQVPTTNELPRRQVRDRVCCFATIITICFISGSVPSPLTHSPSTHNIVQSYGHSLPWFAYATRTLVLRFYDLASKADSLDILLILLGYVLMHLTFILLIRRSRALGSTFSLPAGILSSAVLALLLSLPIAVASGIRIDFVALTEALPFLVCTVGFDKPVRLANAVFEHPEVFRTLNNKGKDKHAPPPGQLKPSARIVLESLSAVYAPIIRDYLLEIIVLVIGANSKKHDHYLPFISLSLLFRLHINFLIFRFAGSSKSGLPRDPEETRSPTRLCHHPSPVQRRSSVIRSFLRLRQFFYLASQYLFHVYDPSTHTPAMSTVRSLSRKMSSTLLGVKASIDQSRNTKALEELAAKQENPVARLKLLLIASFLTLHIMNLVTPLTTPVKPHNAVSTSSGFIARKVDITSPAIRSVLDNLALAEAGNDVELMVKVYPAISVRVVPPPSLDTASDNASDSPDSKFDNFMSGWTRLVGDPVISKWIVVVLAISISLNGYLLKGIAMGMGMQQPSAAAGVRFTGGEEKDSWSQARAKAFESRRRKKFLRSRILRSELL